MGWPLSNNASSLLKLSNYWHEQYLVCIQPCDKAIRGSAIHRQLRFADALVNRDTLCYTMPAFGVLARNHKRGRTMERPTLGDFLRQHRLAAGLTQSQLAELAGVRVRSIGNIETNSPRLLAPIRSNSLPRRFSSPMKNSAFDWQYFQYMHRSIQRASTPSGASTQRGLVGWTQPRDRPTSSMVARGIRATYHHQRHGWSGKNFARCAHGEHSRATLHGWHLLHPLALT